MNNEITLQSSKMIKFITSFFFILFCENTVFAQSLSNDFKSQEISRNKLMEEQKKQQLKLAENKKIEEFKFEWLSLVKKKYTQNFLGKNIKTPDFDYESIIGFYEMANNNEKLRFLNCGTNHGDAKIIYATKAKNHQIFFYSIEKKNSIYVKNIESSKIVNQERPIFAENRGDKFEYQHNPYPTLYRKKVNSSEIQKLSCHGVSDEIFNKAFNNSLEFLRLNSHSQIESFINIEYQSILNTVKFTNFPEIFNGDNITIKFINLADENLLATLEITGATNEYTRALALYAQSLLSTETSKSKDACPIEISVPRSPKQKFSINTNCTQSPQTEMINTHQKRDFIYMHKPEYPKSARLSLSEGSVTVGFCPDPNGLISHAIVLSSSGSDKLDFEALEAIKKSKVSNAKYFECSKIKYTFKFTD